MAKIDFKCLQCGRCCKHLLVETEYGLAGLSLFPEEKNLFPSELISPNVGIGWGIPSGPKHVTTYQLNVSGCPHLSKGNLCDIHNKRPLVCQAFPLRLRERREAHIANSSQCTFIEEVEGKIGSLNRILPMTSKEFIAPKEWRVINEIRNLIDSSIIDHPMDARVLWVFDLKNREWQIATAV